MIRHTVLFKAKHDISVHEMACIYAEIHNLKKHLTGIISILCGECDFHEATEIRPFSHGFSIDFKDQQALDSFFHDPVTYPVKEMIIKACAGGARGIIGFNFKGDGAES